MRVYGAVDIGETYSLDCQGHCGATLLGMGSLKNNGWKLGSEANMVHSEKGSGPMSVLCCFLLKI